MTISSTDIGGYRELALPRHNTGIHHNAMKLQSARAAICLFLENSHAKLIYLPNYICQELVLAVTQLGNVKVVFYDITDQLLPKKRRVLRKNEFMLLVNYFGLCDIALDNYITLSQLNPDSYIIDNSQALFAPPKECAATIYSPRKFIGIPDGGYLYANTTIIEPEEEFYGEKWMTHLLMRASGKVKDGYKYYLLSEKALEDSQPKKMSTISQKLIMAQDLDNLKLVRKKNYQLLNCSFGELNRFQFQTPEDLTPLCYPLWLDYDVTDICRRLSQENIFLPRYWSNSVAQSKLAADIYNATLFIPLDEGISEEKMQVLIKKIKEEISKHSLQL